MATHPTDPPTRTAPTAPADAVDAVVPAGSVNRIPLVPGRINRFKALIPLQGRPLIAYVLDALTAARGVRRIFVVGPPEVLEVARQWPRVEVIPEGGSLVENVRRGLAAASTERVLVCNPDQPLLRPHVVEAFLQAALPLDADLVSIWVREADLAPFPEARRKLATFGDGRYAHGNLFLVRRDFPALEAARRRLDRLYRARKSTFRFAWALGPALFLAYLRVRLARQLPTLTEVLDYAGRHFGVRLRAVILPCPETVADVDEPEDYAGAERALTAASPARSEAAPPAPADTPPCSRS